LDKINGTFGAPLPPSSMMPKGRVFAPPPFIIALGGRGFLVPYYYLGKNKWNIWTTSPPPPPPPILFF